MENTYVLAFIIAVIVSAFFIYFYDGATKMEAHIVKQTPNEIISDAKHMAEIGEMQSKIDALTKSRDQYKDAWFAQKDTIGKSYWDGARYGYEQGLKGEPAYNIDKMLVEKKK